jgi:hypothetical protein
VECTGGIWLGEGVRAGTRSMSIPWIGIGGGNEAGWGGWVVVLVGVGGSGWVPRRLAGDRVLVSADGREDGRLLGVCLLVGGGRYSGSSVLLADPPLLLPWVLVPSPLNISVSGEWTGGRLRVVVPERLLGFVPPLRFGRVVGGFVPRAVVGVVLTGTVMASSAVVELMSVGVDIVGEVYLGVWGWVFWWCFGCR